MFPFMGMPSPHEMMGELGIVLSETMADEDAPEEARELAKSLAVEMMKAGAIALALGVTDEHIASCDHHDHSPAGFLEHLASLAPERNSNEESFNEVREKFQQAMRDGKAEQSLENLPETLHVSDILGEGETENDNE